MSIYDAIANPMVPNIAQAVMQGTQLRQSQNKEEQNAQLFPLQLQAAQQGLEKGALEINQMRNRGIDYDRESKRLNLVRSRAQAASDLLSPMVDMDEAGQVEYFSANAPLLQTLLPEGVGLPESPAEIPHFLRGIALLTEATGDAEKSTREINRLRMAGNIREAERLEAQIEQDYRDKMVPKVGQTAITRNGETRMIQTAADLDWAIQNRAVPLPQQVQDVPYRDSRVRADALPTFAATTRTALQTMDRVVELLDEQGDRIVSFTGALSSSIDTVVSQVTVLAELAGGTAEIDGNTVSESALRQVGHYEAELSGVARRFGVPAAKAAALQSNLINLAYLLARSARPDGRLSQADVKAQLQVITAGGGSANQMRSALAEARSFSIRQMQNIFSELGETPPEWLGEYIDGPSTTPTSPATTTPTPTTERPVSAQDFTEEERRRELERRRAARQRTGGR